METVHFDRTSETLDKSVVVIGMVLIACSFYFLRSADPDLWWHIKTGEIVFASGDVPRFDSFSFSAAAKPWIDHEWGTHALFYFFHSFFGDLGLTALKTLLGMGTAATLFYLTRVPYRGAHVLVWLLASDIVAFYALTRPQMVSYFFVSLLVLMLARKEAMVASLRACLSVPLIFLLWANFHAGFVAGLALLAAHTGLQCFINVFRRDTYPRERTLANRLLWVFAASLVATCLTPYGFDLWRVLWREFNVNAMNRQYIPEWAPLWLSFGLDGQYFILMGVLALLGFLLRPDAWRPEEALLASCVFALSVYSVRNIPFFAIVAARPVARSIGSYLVESRRNIVSRFFFVVLFTAALMPAVLKTYFVIRHPSPKIIANSPITGTMPANAVSFLITHRANGNLYNPLEWGGYLIWHLPPRLKISIDGRSSMVYPKEILREHYRFYTNQVSTMTPLKRGADFVLLKASGAITRRMSADPQWTAVYHDDTAAIFAANTPSGRELIERKRSEQFLPPLERSSDRFP